MHGLLLSTQRLKACTTPHVIVFQECSMYRTRTSRFRTPVSVEKEGGWQGKGLQRELTGSHRYSGVAMFLSGEVWDMETFGRAGMGAGYKLMG